MIPLDTDELVAFLESASKRNLLVALITSGGTAVPLEINMVRFLDNFSNGSRGALSAEQFLEHGYAVVFLYRRYSNLPFYRASITEHWMDMLEPGSLIVRKDPLECYNLLKELSEKREKYSKNLILIPYFSLEEYMSWLEFTCTSLDSFGKRALIYSAAAVSDFYIPSERLSEHKIDSASMELVLNLVPVRKMLGIIRTEWCPNAVLISFKASIIFDHYILIILYSLKQILRFC